MSQLERKKNMLAALVVFLIVVLVGGSFILGQELSREVDRSNEIAVQQTEEKKEVVEEARQALCGTDDKLIYDPELCAKWAGILDEPPPVVPDALENAVDQEALIAAFRVYCDEGNCRGADGQTPGPEDIAAAFGRFCADGRCNGTDGKDGQDAAPVEPPADGVDGTNGTDGQNATPEMVLAAVTTYCAEGACVGPAGANGEPGPPPTAEAIAEAVANFCADGRCAGPQGPPGVDSTVPGPAGPVGETGATGASGAPGRGIQSIQCQQEPEYAWIVTYTDGTSEAIPGPCRVADQPGPPEIPPGQVTP